MAKTIKGNLEKDPSYKAQITNTYKLFSLDIRQQINEQLKCLDMRVEVQAAIVAEIQDFFRRRAEVELEYSRSLEKLSRSLTLRHKAEKQKREQWHLFSSNLCWEHLLSATRKESRDRAILSEIFANTLTSRFGEIVEDVHRMYKRCREIGMESHEELLKVLHELHASMKTYHAYHSDERQMESKLRLLEAQKTKLEQSAPAEKLQRLKKYRLIVKDLQKRQSKYNDAKLKSLKARNDYLLCMDAANAAVQKYYVDDLPDLIDWQIIEDELRPESAHLDAKDNPLLGYPWKTVRPLNCHKCTDVEFGVMEVLNTVNGLERAGKREKHILGIIVAATILRIQVRFEYRTDIYKMRYGMQLSLLAQQKIKQEGTKK
ncbi:SLIT-ROBO Rho GTPase-activating protein 3-like [Limulus polyphemus]|uniref:SLIT-ROBO Rho GTPase-activating protein 3-like n=1 Tax=Limulus polyphemus TaxID=6850 RepID=A0ABM1B725_LIMPO|nr:SLIT-ROBO Rho GTPase-activating protein 3-like [Limulus polyphemus]